MRLSLPTSPPLFMCVLGGLISSLPASAPILVYCEVGTLVQQGVTQHRGLVLARNCSCSPRV